MADPCQSVSQSALESLGQPFPAEPWSLSLGSFLMPACLCPLFACLPACVAQVLWRGSGGGHGQDHRTGAHRTAQGRYGWMAGWLVGEAASAEREVPLEDGAIHGSSLPPKNAPHRRLLAVCGWVGWWVVVVQVGRSFFPCTFTVLEKDDMDFLFGLDMLKRHQCVIDLKRGVLQLGETAKKKKHGLVAPPQPAHGGKRAPLSAPICMLSPPSD